MSIEVIIMEVKDLIEVVSSLTRKVGSDMAIKSFMEDKELKRYRLEHQSWLYSWLVYAVFVVMFSGDCIGVIALMTQNFETVLDKYAVCGVCLIIHVAVTSCLLEYKLRLRWNIEILRQNKAYRASFRIIQCICYIGVFFNVVVLFASAHYADSSFVLKVVSISTFIALSGIIPLITSVLYSLHSKKDVVFEYTVCLPSINSLSVKSCYVDAVDGVKVITGDVVHNVDLTKYGLYLVGRSTLLIDDSTPVILEPADYDYISICKKDGCIDKWKFENSAWVKF